MKIFRGGKVWRRLGITLLFMAFALGAIVS